MSDNPKTVAANLKRYLRRLGTLQEASSKLGVGPTTISNQLNGKAYFTRKNAARYAAIFGVNADYLVTGEGELCPQFNSPKNLFPLFTETQKDAGSVEERIVLGIRAHLKKLDDLGHTYNSLVERITELAECIQGGPYLDYCQRVIKALENSKVNLDPRINPLYEDMFGMAEKGLL